MAEMIARLRADIENRLREVERELAALEPLAAEKSKLERVLATPPFAVEKPASRPARGRPAAKRAPRGANKAAVYEAVRDMPGATPGEIAAASKVAKAQVFGVLRAGVARGDLATVNLGGGRTGYRMDERPATAFPAPANAEPRAAEAAGLRTAEVAEPRAPEAAGPPAAEVAAPRTPEDPEPSAAESAEPRASEDPEPSAAEVAEPRASEEVGPPAAEVAEPRAPEPDTDAEPVEAIAGGE